MSKINIKNIKDPIVVEVSESLLDALLREQVEINHSCGGMGSCGTCRVIIQEHQKLHPRNKVEKMIAEDRGFKASERLACQTKPCPSGIEVEVPKPEQLETKT